MFGVKAMLEERKKALGAFFKARDKLVDLDKKIGAQHEVHAKRVSEMMSEMDQMEVEQGHIQDTIKKINAITGDQA